MKISILTTVITAIFLPMLGELHKSCTNPVGTADKPIIISASSGPNPSQWDEVPLVGSTRPWGVNDNTGTRPSKMQRFLRVISYPMVVIRVDKINKTTGIMEYHPIFSSFTTNVLVNNSSTSQHYRFNFTYMFECELGFDYLVKVIDKNSRQIGDGLVLDTIHCPTCTYGQGNCANSSGPLFEGDSTCSRPNKTELSNIIDDTSQLGEWAKDGNEIQYDIVEDKLKFWVPDNVTMHTSTAALDIDNLLLHFNVMNTTRLVPKDLSNVDEHSDHYHEIRLSDVGGGCGALRIQDDITKESQVLPVCFNEEYQPEINPTFDNPPPEKYISYQGFDQYAENGIIKMCYNSHIFFDYAKIWLTCEPGVTKLLDYSQSMSQLPSHASCTDVLLRFGPIKREGYMKCSVECQSANGKRVKIDVDLKVVPPPKLSIHGISANGEGRFPIKFSENATILANFTIAGKHDMPSLICDLSNQTALKIIQNGRNYSIAVDEADGIVPVKCRLQVNGTGGLVAKDLIIAQDETLPSYTAFQIVMYVCIAILGICAVFYCTYRLYKYIKTKISNNNGNFTITFGRQRN